MLYLTVAAVGSPGSVPVSAPCACAGSEVGFQLRPGPDNMELRGDQAQWSARSIGASHPVLSIRETHREESHVQLLKSCRDLANSDFGNSETF